MGNDMMDQIWLMDLYIIYKALCLPLKTEGCFKWAYKHVKCKQQHKLCEKWHFLVLCTVWNISADSIFSPCCCFIFPQDHQVRWTHRRTNYHLKHPPPLLSTLRRNPSLFVSQYNKTVWTRRSSREPETEGREGFGGRKREIESDRETQRERDREEEEREKVVVGF